MQQLDTDGYITIPNASRFLGVSRDAVRSLLKRGLLTAHRPFAKILIDRDELIRFVRASANVERCGRGRVAACGDYGTP